MAEIKITKNKVIPFIDVSKTANTDSWAPVWKRIDKSTVFDLAFNPQSESVDYISMASAVEEISSYQPELPQEIACYRGNPIYDFIEDTAIHLPVGDDTKVPVLLAWPPETENAETVTGWQVPDNRLLLGSYNSVEGKVTYTLKMGGDIVTGTISRAESGAPTFTPDAN